MTEGADGADVELRVGAEEPGKTGREWCVVIESVLHFANQLVLDGAIDQSFFDGSGTRSAGGE